MVRQKLPIGIDLFEKLRRNDYYYVDKTNIIRDLLDNMAEVSLFTRPRRFGKTLNMSMLQCFFEKTDRDNRDLFAGLAIEQAGEAYWRHHARYPVVFLTLKGVEGDTFESTMERLAILVGMEATRHAELRDSPKLSPDERAMYARLCATSASHAELSLSLLTLSSLLEKHHGEKALILIDEYDVPLDKAYMRGYYKQMVSLMRVFLGDALKTNPALGFAVLTGCLRISRESIFTGLNNLKVISIRFDQYASYFGFTTAEVERLLAAYGVSQRMADARDWYDGYWFRNEEIYNPWDILNFCDMVARYPDAEAKSYWINSSGNDIIRLFIERAGPSTRREIESLIDGGTVTKVIREEITYGEIDEDPDNLWSFLFLTGYLTSAGPDDGGNGPMTLRIPNREVRGVYIEKIQKWFGSRVRSSDLSALYQAFLEGDAPVIERELGRLLLSTISYHDGYEGYYHGFLTGVLKPCANWAVASNREAGEGRSDILLEGWDNVRAAVIEVKRAADVRGLDAACDAAMAQIEERRYAQELADMGYLEIWQIGIAFFGKRCRVRCAPFLQ